MSVDPAKIELSCFIGADYDETYFLWSDENETILLDLTGWSQFVMVIGLLTLTPGQGLSINLAGRVTATIPRSVTRTMLPGSVAYSLSAVDPNGDLQFLMSDLFIWEAAR